MKTAIQRLPYQFIVDWYPRQFRAWKRSKQQKKVTREHEDADEEFENLPDSVKMNLLILVPLQLDMFLRFGKRGLRGMRNAALIDDRESFYLEELAESYHNLWYLQRLQQFAILKNPPTMRPDDVPWGDLAESYRTECLGIIWQLCRALAELKNSDFEILCDAAD